MNLKFNLSKLRFVIQLLYLILFIFGLLSNPIIFLLIIISSIILGPVFCGWLCFVGFYQDVLRYIGSIFRKEPLVINENIQKYLKYSRYLLLIGTVTLGGLFLFPSQVWFKFSQLVTGKVVIDLAFYSIVILGLFSLVSNRLFCRYFCTFGAKLGLYGLFRVITINRDDSCISCKCCAKTCLMGISVDTINSLANPNCVNCLKCVEVCPKSSLKLGFRRYTNP